MNLVVLLLAVASVEVCWVGDDAAGLVSALDHAAPGVSVRRCSRCRGELCARLEGAQLVLSRADGRTYRREVGGSGSSSASVSDRSVSLLSVYLESLVLQAQLDRTSARVRARAPPDPPEALPPPPTSTSSAPPDPPPVPAASSIAGGRVRARPPALAPAPELRLGLEGGVRFRGPDFLGPSVAASLQAGWFRARARGDLPAGGRVGAFSARAHGAGLEVGAGLRLVRGPRLEVAADAGLALDWLRVRIEGTTPELQARADGFGAGASVGLSGNLDLHPWIIGARANALVFPAGFGFSAAEEGEIGRIGRWGGWFGLSISARP